MNPLSLSCQNNILFEGLIPDNPPLEEEDPYTLEGLSRDPLLLRTLLCYFQAEDIQNLMCVSKTLRDRIIPHLPGVFSAITRSFIDGLKLNLHTVCHERQICYLYHRPLNS